MRNSHLVLIIGLTLILIQNGYAIEFDSIDRDNLRETLRSLRNPFVPRTPKPKQELPSQRNLIDMPEERRNIDREFESERKLEPPVRTPRSVKSELPSENNTTPEVKPPPQPATPKLEISGLIWNSDRPQAIINGRVLGIGDSIMGVPSDIGEIIPKVNIIGITSKGIDISFSGRTIRVSLEKEQPE